MSGLGNKIKGSAKEVAGKLTGDKKLEAEGNAEQLVGNIKDRAEDMKDKVGDTVNKALRKGKEKIKKPRGDVR